jgi:ribosomal protein S10
MNNIRIKSFEYKNIIFFLKILNKSINILNSVLINVLIIKKNYINISLLHIILNNSTYVHNIIEDTNISFLLLNILSNNYNFNYNTNSFFINKLNYLNKKNSLTNFFFLYYSYLNYHYSLLNLIKENLKISNFVMLPKRLSKITLQRSPHTDKKAREQFCKTSYIGRCYLNSNLEVNQFLSKLYYLNSSVYLNIIYKKQN